MVSQQGRPLISIIIVSYNVRELLLECIRSISVYITFPVEIIVADNNSSDGTVEALQNLYPAIKLIANKNNPGFSAANNQALAVAGGDYIFFLNPDTELKDDSLNRFMDEFINANEEKMIAGPLLLNSDGTYQESCWKFPNPLHHLADLFFLSKVLHPASYKREKLKDRKEVDFLSGAALLMTKKNADRLTGFDEILFWMEDVDLCRRNSEAGGTNVYFPNARLLHHSGQSGKKNYNVQISNQVISKLKFYKKHDQYVYFFLSGLIFFLQILTRIPLFLLVSPINNTFFKKCKAYTFTLRKFFQYLFLNTSSVT